MKLGNSLPKEVDFLAGRRFQFVGKRKKPLDELASVDNVVVVVVLFRFVSLGSLEKIQLGSIHLNFIQGAVKVNVTQLVGACCTK